MRYLAGASTIAIAISLVSGAQAQVANTTPSNANVLNLLSPFLGLNTSPTGPATLQTNLDQAVATNNAANTLAQQLSVSDKNLLGSATNTITGAAGTYGAGANLAGGLPDQSYASGNASIPTVTGHQPVGGLGTQLGQIYVNGSSTGLTSPLGSFVNLLARAYTFTSTDLGISKFYFANGTTNGSTVAVAPAGFTLPTASYTIPAGSPAGAAGSTGTLPNTSDSVLDIAGGVRNTQSGQDVYGSSRPIQVAPNRINQFDPTAISGLSTNPSFPSGHTTYAYTDGILLAMAVPQQYQSMVLRASEYGNSRIVLGVHYPLDIIASRALASYDLAQAFTNPLYINNAATTGTAIDLPTLFTTGTAQIQSYLSAQCGSTVAACATSAANTANNPYVPSAANQALYLSRLTYNLPTLSFAQAPRETAPAGGPDASILLATLYGGSTSAAATIAPTGGLLGNLQTGTINQILVNTETNALSAFYGTNLSYWTRLNLYDAAGYFGNIVGTIRMDPADQLNTDVTVNNTGALYANGTIAGVATVNSGGLLGGSGRVGGVVINGGGTLAPGNSIGTLNVSGNVTFNAGSTYQVEANAAGKSDRTVATGGASLRGGTVQVLAAAGAYNPRTTYNILTAAAGVSGTFAGVTSNLAFLNPFLAYDANNVNLTLVRNDVPFASVAATRNEASTAGGIQSTGFGNPIYNAVAPLSDGQARQAFDALSGEVHSSEVTSQVETAFMVQESVLDRLRGGFGMTGGLPGFAAGATVPGDFAADLPGKRRIAPVPVGATLDPRVFTLWGEGFGTFGSTSTNGNAGTLTRNTGGFVIGADATLDGAYRFGVAGGYTDTNFDVRARTSSGEVRSGFGSVYGAASFGNVTARVGGVFASNTSDTRRNVAFAGFTDSVRGRFGGTTLQGFGEVGYRLTFGNATIEPILGGAGIVIGRDRFTETGGPSALTVFGRDYTIETITAGIRGDVALAAGSPFTLRGLLAYRGAFGDVSPVALLAFANGGATFSSAGIPIDRHALVAEAGLDWKVAPNLTVGVSYAGQVGARANDNGVRGNLVYKF